MKINQSLPWLVGFLFCVTVTLSQQQLDGYSYIGDHFCIPLIPETQLTAADPQECADLCSSDANCEHFSVNEDANECVIVTPPDFCVNITFPESAMYHKNPPGEEGGGESGGASGDPHFSTWADGRYDYHGICDLVLLKNPHFQGGVGMDINVRTKQIRQWSYISNAAIRIGDDVLEIEGDNHQGFDSNYWLNGVLGTSAELTTQNNDDLVILPMTLSGYPILHRRSNSHQHEYFVDIGNGEKIHVTTWKNIVGVHIEGATHVNFGRSSGLLGSFGSGEHIARDGKTIMEDADEFGQEWQVLANEVKLFHSLEGPQAPEKCRIPSATTVRRRLQASQITQEMADMACSGVVGANHNDCVFDVMATNDLGVAGAY